MKYLNSYILGEEIVRYKDDLKQSTLLHNVVFPSNIYILLILQ